MKMYDTSGYNTLKHQHARHSCKFYKMHQYHKRRIFFVPVYVLRPFPDAFYLFLFSFFTICFLTRANKTSTKFSKDLKSLLNSHESIFPIQTPNMRQKRKNPVILLTSDSVSPVISIKRNIVSFTYPFTKSFLLDFMFDILKSKNLYGQEEKPPQAKTPCPAGIRKAEISRTERR